MSTRNFVLWALTVVLTATMACSGPAATPTPTPPRLAEELIFYDWEEDIPQSVLDGFTEEYGVRVTYLTYEAQEDALANIQAGKVYDVVVLDNDYIPEFVRRDLLAEIDYRNVPNFKNISASFRDLAYDPGNKHSLPFNWGTTGLVIRSDLVEKPVTRWADLWQLADAHKIAMRDEPRDQLGAALKSLGYSINTEDPDELEKALEHLLEIRPQVVVVDPYAEAVIPLLVSGEVVAVIGWAEDALEGREEHESIVYVLPEEGPMLWGDNFVIPTNSPRKVTAEVFLNYLLRPQVAAQIVNENTYASANESASPYIDPEIRDDPVIFPSSEDLANAEIYLPLTAEGEALYQDTWQRFKAAVQ
jgi:spermidine/putrescine transport system substrate-binding protein